MGLSAEDKIIVDREDKSEETYTPNASCKYVNLVQFVEGHCAASNG